MVDPKVLGRDFRLFVDDQEIGGIANVVLPTVREPEPDLQELGARHFERLCAEAGVKCIRLGRSD